MKTTFLSILLIAGMATYTLAQNPPAKKTEKTDKRPIHQGVKSGKLTKSKNLKEGVEALKKDKKLAKADSGNSNSEKKKSAKTKKQVKPSKEIYIQKHGQPIRH